MTSLVEENYRPAIDSLLAGAGWSGASISPLAGDASSRSYMRLVLGDKKAVLMIAPPNAETAPCPPEATEAERKALGYNACARLAGPNLSAFLAIASALKMAGLSSPEVYAANHKDGLAIIEDLGDDLFARVAGRIDETKLYHAAADVLLRIRSDRPAPAPSSDYSMLSYDETALLAETDLLLDWYWPLKTGKQPDAQLRHEYTEIFGAMLQLLSSERVLVLRDYHAENLLWLPERKGPARVGLIDFQDGLLGSPAYDLVSLLEDARRDIAPELSQSCYEYYCQQALAAGAFDPHAFETDFATLAAQRNAKILGIFARLAKRDGKPRYLDMLPRVEKHFRRDLNRPVAKPLRDFIVRHLPELNL